MADTPEKLEIDSSLVSLTASAIDQHYADGSTIRWITFDLGERASSVSIDRESAAELRDWLSLCVDKPTA